MKRILIRGLVCFLLLFGLHLINSNQALNSSVVVQAAEKTKKAHLNYEKLVLEPNQSKKLKLTGVSGKVTWKSSNKSVATVSNNGTVKAKGYGSAVITATVSNKTYKCNVKVTYSITMDAYEHYQHYSADFISDFPLVLLDMNSTFKDFKSVGYKTNGIYAAVHSDKKIYIEALDKKGKSLGIHENQGLSYMEFKNAVKLRIMNPDNIRYTIDFIPVKPTVIDKSGHYRYDDFLWYKLKDGNIQAPIIIAMENAYIEYVQDEDKDKSNNENAMISAGYLPHNTGAELDPEYMNAWRVGYITAIDKDKKEELKYLYIFVNEYKVYIDEEDIFVYGKADLEFPEDYKEMLYSYRDAVKAVGTKYYLPGSDIWKKPFRIRFTYEFRSSAEKDYMSMNINDDSLTYYHELTHYYHLEKMDYGCQISAWTEGIACAMAEDVVKKYDEDKNKGYVPFKIQDGISDEQLNDFEKYFLNVGYEDCYTIGYYFIRYIQKEYGKSVVLKINKKISKIPTIEGYGISPSRRSEESDNLFIKAIKDATSEDVFTRFIEEELKNLLSNMQDNYETDYSLQGDKYE